ncbi:MAG: hypothetical protein [Bacteriophage sp.]|nr:MAG: hypothetical protein [Bacteriophage sp.]
MEIKEKIVSNWKQVFKSYSFIFHVLAALLTVVEIILPHMSLIESAMTPKTYGIVMFVLNVAGGLGRFIKQKKVTSDVSVA